MGGGAGGAGAHARIPKLIYFPREWLMVKTDGVIVCSVGGVGSCWRGSRS